MDLPVAPLSASIAALAGTSNSAIVWRLASCLASSLAASSIASEREPSVVRMAPTSGREVGAAHCVEIPPPPTKRQKRASTELYAALYVMLYPGRCSDATGMPSNVRRMKGAGNASESGPATFDDPIASPQFKPSPPGRQVHSPHLATSHHVCTLLTSFTLRSCKYLICPHFLSCKHLSSPIHIAFGLRCRHRDKWGNF